MPKLSELNPDDIKLVQPAQAEDAPLKLSDLDPKDVTPVQSEPGPTTTATQAGILGAANSATLGYSPNIAAGVKTLQQTVAPDYGPQQSYEELKNQYAQNEATASKEHPYASALGKLGGAVATAPLMGAGLGRMGLMTAEGAGTGANLLRAGAGGALVGAAQNPGETQDLGSDLRQRTINAATGGAVGAAGQGVANVLGKITDSSALLKNFAEMRGFAAVGANKGAAKDAVFKDKGGIIGKTQREIGRFALDNKLVQVGDTIEDVANKTSSLKDSVGSKIGDLYKKATEFISNPKFQNGLSQDEKTKLAETAFNAKKMGDEFLSNFSYDITGHPEGDQAISAAEKLVSNFQKNKADMDFQDLNKFKTSLQNIIYVKDRALQRMGMSSPGDIAYGKFLGFIKDKINDRLQTLDSVFGDTLGSSIKDLNKQYNLSSDIYNIARNRYTSETGNNFFSLTDKLAGFGGAEAGFVHGMMKGGIEKGLEHAAVGAAASLASKASRTYGRPIVTKSADIAGNIAGGAGNLINAITPNGVPQAINQAITQNPAVAGAVSSQAFNPALKKNPQQKGLLGK